MKDVAQEASVQRSWVHRTDIGLQQRLQRALERLDEHGADAASRVRAAADEGAIRTHAAEEDMTHMLEKVCVRGGGGDWLASNRGLF